MTEAMVGLMDIRDIVVAFTGYLPRGEQHQCRLVCSEMRDAIETALIEDALEAVITERVPLMDHVSTRLVERLLATKQNAAWENILESARKINFLRPRRVFRYRILDLVEREDTELEYVDLSQSNFGDPELIPIANHSPMLKRLNVSDSRVTDIGVNAVAMHCHAVEHLDASYSDGKIGPSSLAPFFQATGDHLTSLDLRGCDRQICDSLLTSLSTMCPNLRYIRLDHAEGRVTDHSIQALVKGLPTLQRLSLNTMGGTVTDTTLDLIAKNCPRGLLELQVGRSRGKVTDAGIQAIASHCSSLEHLNFQGAGMTDVSLLILATSNLRSTLRCLNLSECTTPLSSESVRRLLEECVNIQKLWMEDAPRVDTTAILPLISRRPSQLQLLDVARTVIGNNALAAVSENCSSTLTALNISSTSVTEVGLKAIAQKCKCLKYLSALKCSFSDGLIEQFAHLDMSEVSTRYFSNKSIDKGLRFARWYDL